MIPTSELLSRARAAVDAWAPVSNHPNMIGLRAAFVSSEMEDATASLFFAHDYHPGSVTLAQVGGVLTPLTASPKSGLKQVSCLIPPFPETHSCLSVSFFLETLSHTIPHITLSSFRPISCPARPPQGSPS